MEAFFVSIILIGILIVCFALIWMVIEKKRTLDYRLEIDERRYELKQTIEDADQLLAELNNFSSYIVNKLEEKQLSVENTIIKADESIEFLEQNVYMNSAQAPRTLIADKEVKEAIVGISGTAGISYISEIEEITENAENEADKAHVAQGTQVAQTEDDEPIALTRKKGKLIPFDERKREVIKLHKKGVSSTEIAKTLSMGKGEIELISRMCQ